MERFILTKELGRLAKWLRIFGFDAVYFKENKKSSLIISALREERIVLTRNKLILKDKALKILFIQSEEIKEQLKQMIKELDLKINPENMFTRCILCNEPLAQTPKNEVKGLVPEYVFQTQEEFSKCSKCNRIYWQGTHWGNVNGTLKKIQNGVTNGY